MADALNAGLEAASGDVVVQLDADATLETPGWLERMVAFMDSDDRVGAVTARVAYDWGELHACGIEVTGPGGPARPGFDHRRAGGPAHLPWRRAAPPRCLPSDG